MKYKGKSFFPESSYISSSLNSLCSLLFFMLRKKKTCFSSGQHYHLFLIALMYFFVIFPLLTLFVSLLKIFYP